MKSSRSNPLLTCKRLALMVIYLSRSDSLNGGDGGLHRSGGAAMQSTL
jgi:hypothetical protein